jgi:hypothetical protein
LILFLKVHVLALHAITVQNILWNVDPLQGSSHKISNYTTAVAW